MKLGELNNTNLGKRITITGRDSTVTGILAGVSHEAELIADGRLTDAEPHYTLGRPITRITIQGWGARRLTPDTECKVEG